jgi:hypothetical protein
MVAMPSGRAEMQIRPSFPLDPTNLKVHTSISGVITPAFTRSCKASQRDFVARSKWYVP